MHDILRERVLRNLETLPEDRLYQVLDYIEFLNSKYARGGARPATGLRRFGEKLEDHMRMNGVAFGAIRGTMEAMGNADRLVNDVAQIGKSLLRDVEDGLKPPTEPRDRTAVRTLPRPPAEEPRG